MKGIKLRDSKNTHTNNFYLLECAHIARLPLYWFCLRQLSWIFVCFHHCFWRSVLSSALCPGKPSSKNWTLTPSGFQLGSTSGRQEQESGGHLGPNMVPIQPWVWVFSFNSVLYAPTLGDSLKITMRPTKKHLEFFTSSYVPPPIHNYTAHFSKGHG